MLARFTRKLASGLLVGGIALALTLAASQERFDSGVFEFGNPRALAGRIEADPYPVLAMTVPGASIHSRLILVGSGKSGAEGEVQSLEGKDTELDGTLIYRDDMTMAEIVPSSATSSGADAEPTLGGSTVVSLGFHTLQGEIIDLKCYLGVMKPGRGKPHRSCAVNCIRGGIPPVLVADGEYYLLVDTDDQPVNQRVLDVVAEPIEITGEIVQKDNLYYLRADPELYKRLAES